MHTSVNSPAIIPGNIMISRLTSRFTDRTPATDCNLLNYPCIFMTICTLTAALNREQRAFRVAPLCLESITDRRPAARSVFQAIASDPISTVLVTLSTGSYSLSMWAWPC